MKKLMWMVAFVSIITFYQNCTATHETDSNALSSTGLTLEEQISLSAYETTLFPIMSADDSCAQCHGVNQQPLHSIPDAPLAHEIITSFNLVDLNDPANSEIVTKVRRGHRGFGSADADELEAAIQAWADGITAAGGTPGGPNPDVLQPTFSSISLNILEPKCVGCHSSSGSRPQTDYTSYVNTVNTGGVTAFNAAASPMFTQCQSGLMPEGGPSLSFAELGVIQTWIDSGALNN